MRDKFHVLIVKTEPQIASLWEQALERAGYLVSCVNCAGAALRRWETERIDAAVIDDALSDMSGADLAEVIRERWPDSHVLLLARAEAGAAAHLAGDSKLQLLPKVVTTRMLKKRLEQLLLAPQQPYLYYGHRQPHCARSASRPS